MNEANQNAVADLHEMCASYALGALDTSERLAFEDHLRQGCPACAEDLRAFTGVANAIGESVASGPPKPLRQRLLSMISRTPRIPGILLQHGGLLIARSEEMAWQTMAPGIEYRPLYEDAPRKFHTSLVRMDAGAHYPSHQHAAIEELFMISGDLHVENQVMRAGDYCRADSGSIHGETFTDSGCMFLMMASLENQIIENRAGL